MRYAMLVVLGLMLFGCSTSTQHVTKYAYIAPSEKYDDELYPVVKSLAAQLLRSRKSWKEGYTMAMTSVVNLDNLSQTDAFGRQVSESLFAALSEKSVQMVEPRISSQLSMVPSEGEFVLSRESAKLVHELEVTYILVGSYQQSRSGYHVNVRIVALETRNVVAAGYKFFSSDVTSIIPSVRVLNGGLVRDDISYQ